METYSHAVLYKVIHLIQGLLKYYKVALVSMLLME